MTGTTHTDHNVRNARGRKRPGAGKNRSVDRNPRCSKTSIWTLVLDVEGNIPASAVLGILSLAEVEGKAKCASVIVAVRRVCRPVRTWRIAIASGIVSRPVGANVVVAGGWISCPIRASGRTTHDVCWCKYVVKTDSSRRHSDQYYEYQDDDLNSCPVRFGSRLKGCRRRLVHSLNTIRPRI